MFKLKHIQLGIWGLSLFTLLPTTIFAQLRSEKQSELYKQIAYLSGSGVLVVYPRLMEIDPSVAFSIPCLPPVDFWEGNRISSDFGWRTHPIDGRFRHHAGIDIAGTHQYVRAAATGIIEKVGYHKNLGYFVRINHGNSYMTTYGHLAQIIVRQGDPVAIGSKIGILGRSGLATGLHLHYAIKKNGTDLDPTPYLLLAIQLVHQYQRLHGPINSPK